jgi:hypothetical protein
VGVRTIVLLLLLHLAAATLPAAVSGQIELVSRSVWRGFDLLPDNRPAIQPGVTFEFADSGFSLDLWGSFALADRAVLQDADEIDVTLAYAFEPAPGWELSGGLICYGFWFADDFSFKDNLSLEVFATIAATGLPLAPTLTAYYDFRLGRGFYVSLGGGHEIKLNETATLELGGLIGFNGGLYIERSAFSNIDAHARLALTAGKVTLAPSLHVMFPLLEEINEETEIWFGLSVAF